jgi:hypothetical protein
MAQTIKIKRSATSGNKLTGSNSIAGEIGMNTADKSLYIQTGSTDASVVTVYDDSILHLDDTNNRVGIGTTSPSNPLHVVGDALVVGTLAADELKVGPTERIYLDGGSNTFIVEDAADDLGIYVGGSRRLRVNTARTVATGDLQVAGGDIEFNQSSGQARIRNLLQDTYLRFQVNVGGTQTNAINIRGNNAYVGIGSAAGGSSPAYPLDVYNASVDGIARFTSGTNRARIEVKDDDTSVFVVAEGSKMGLGTVNALSSSNLTIDASGNLGIGTTVPDSKVTAYNASTGITGLFKLWTNTSNDTAADGGAIEWVGSGDKTAIGSKIAATRVEGGGKMDLRFYTGRNSDSNHEKMRILVDGKVGIGTTSPSYHLHVDAGNNNTTALFESDGVANVVVSGGNNRGSFVVQHSGTTSGALIAKSGGGLEFGVGANYATNVRMVLDSNGAVTFNDAFTFPTAIGSAGQVLKVPTSGTTLYWANEAAASVGTSLSDADGDTKIQVEETADEDRIRFDTAGTQRMVLNELGRLGINTGTPNYLLDIESTSSALLRIYNTGSNVLTSLIAQNDLGTAKFSTQSGYSRIHSGSTLTYAANGTNSIFYSSGTEKMRLTGTGLTIGTATDTTTLEFPDKTGIPDSPTETNDKVQLIKMGQGGNGGMWQTTGRGGMLISSADDSLVLANGDVGRLYDPNAGGDHPAIVNETLALLSDFDIRFTTGLQDGWSGGSTYSPKTSVITAEGRFGIGTTSPGEKLEVIGNVEAEEFIGDIRGATLFKASAGEALAKGDVVYISGISGNTTIVSKADADDASKMPAFGIAAAAASANTPVDVYTSGILSGIDTSSFSEGDELFVSTTAGVLTATPPTGESAALQKIGKVTRSASSGSIFIIGAGRSNATPNLNEGKLFVGNSSNQAVADNTIHVDIANSRVGIGTTSPDSLLEISSASATDFVKLTSTSSSASPIKLIFEKSGSEQGVIEYNRNGNLELYNTDPDGGVLISGSASADGDFYITHGGNVGIGTTSPGRKFTVQGASGDNLPVRIIGGSGTSHGSMEFQDPNTTADYKVTVGSKGDDFYIQAGGGEKVRVKSDGNVGIGTSSPEAKLHTVGHSRLDGAVLQKSGSGITSGNISTNNEYISHNGPVLTNGSTANINQYGYFRGYQAVYGTDGTNGFNPYAQGAYSNPVFEFVSNNRGSISLPTDSAIRGGYLYQFVLGNSGSGGSNSGVELTNSNTTLLWGITSSNHAYFANRVGIGTTSPGTTLDVAGDIRGSGLFTSNQSQQGFRHIAPDVMSGHTSRNEMTFSWTADETRWYMFPTVDGSGNFGRELSFDYSSEEWSIEGPVTLSSLSTGNITTTGYLRGPSTFTIDPSAHGDNTGTVVIAGNLQVDGTTTTINSTTLTVDDLNITLASGSTNAAAANGAGITVDCGSDTDATLTYLSSGDQWKFNKELLVQDSNFPQLRLADADDSMEIGYAGENFFFKRNDNDGAIIFRRTDNSDVMAVNMSTMRVGIGTASPTYGLEVLNDQTSQSATGTMYVQASLNGSGRGLVIDSNTRTTADNSVAALQTITRANTTGLKVQVDGNVGIGTSSPSQKLQVAGTILADTALAASSGNTAIGIGSESNITDGNSTYKAKLITDNNNAKLTTYQYGSYLTLKAGVDGTGYSNNWSKIELRDGGGTGSNNAHMKFYTHGDERMVIDNYGNVGIGTNNPVDNYAAGITPESTKLAVVGANVSGYTEVAHFAAGTDSDNTGATVRIGHVGNDRGMFIKAGRGTSNQAKALLGVRNASNADSNILTLQEGGRVGIGTTSPNYTLDVVSTGGGINIGGTGAYLRWNSGDLQIKNEGSYKMGFYTYNSSDAALNRRMVIDTNGYVGIGTDSPAIELDIKRHTNAYPLRIGSSQGEGRAIAFADVNASPTKYNWIAGTQYNINNGFEITPSTAVGGYTFSNPALAILQDGNVGIGISSPVAKLNVVSSGTIGWSNLANAWVLAGTINYGIGFDNNELACKGTDLYFGTITAHTDVVFRAGGNTQRMLIDGSNGNISIGTNTSPQAKLQVEELGIDTTTTSTSATTQVAIDTFAAATFRSARYTIQVTNSTDSTYHITEILLIHDGTTPQITEYGTIFTGSAEATFDADISSGNVRLLATPATTDSMTFKVVRHCITV